MHVKLLLKKYSTVHHTSPQFIIYMIYCYNFYIDKLPNVKNCRTEHTYEHEHTHIMLYLKEYTTAA
jgi:hypothetical protein